jgi:hypothetical protein
MVPTSRLKVEADDRGPEFIWLYLALLVLTELGDRQSLSLLVLTCTRYGRKMMQ